MAVLFGYIAAAILAMLAAVSLRAALSPMPYFREEWEEQFPTLLGAAAMIGGAVLSAYGAWTAVEDVVGGGAVLGGIGVYYALRELR